MKQVGFLTGAVTGIVAGSLGTAAAMEQGGLTRTAGVVAAPVVLAGTALALGRAGATDANIGAKGMFAVGAGFGFAFGGLITSTVEGIRELFN